MAVGSPTVIDGRHVKVIGRSRAPGLGAVDEVRGVVERIVGACEMRLLGDVRCYDVPVEIERLGAEPFEDEGGVTAIGVLSTSHCAIHTWPARGLFVLDVYSCRNFETLAILDVLRERFGEGLEMRTTDMSSALEMPAEWRQAL